MNDQSEPVPGKRGKRRGSVEELPEKKKKKKSTRGEVEAMSQERDSQLDCLLRRLLCLTASLSPQYVDETLFRASPSPRAHRRCLEKTLLFLFAYAMEAHGLSLLTLLAITWSDAR